MQAYGLIKAFEESSISQYQLEWLGHITVYKPKLQWEFGYQPFRKYVLQNLDYGGVLDSYEH